MKKILSVVLVFLMIPISVFGKTYEAKNSDFEISFDKENWDVFVSGKNQDTVLLEYYHASNESIQSFLDENYAHIFAQYNDTENFVLVVKVNPRKWEYKYDDYNELGKYISEELGIRDYEIYENKYKYIKLENYDSVNEMYIINYCIIANFQYHVFSFQKGAEFSDKEKEEIKKVVDSVTFNENMKQSSEFKMNWKEAINCSIYGMLSSGLTYFIFKKNKKIN